MITQIPEAIIEKITKKTFGAKITVSTVTEIVPHQTFGINRVVGCNGNISYVVTLRNGRRYVFRFSRDHIGREGLFEAEQERYQLISQHTDIPVPGIHSIDKSKSLVNTHYMIMDWMPGDNWRYLCHPNNPETTSHEKELIQKKAGYSYAQIHSIERRATDPNKRVKGLLDALQVLQKVITDGHLDVGLDKIGVCRSLIETQPFLKSEMESLCGVSDADLHFRKIDGEWEPSFICDLEWCDYGNPYQDLVLLCTPPSLRFYELNGPILIDSETERLPVLLGYQELRPIEFRKLHAIALYFHFGMMCSLAYEFYNPHKKDYMKSREPLYNAIVNAIAEGMAVRK